MLGTLTPEQKKIGKVMSLLWYMPIIAPGIQPLSLAPTFCYLAGSLDFQWMWNLDYKGEAIGFPWGVQLHIPTKEEATICLQKSQAHGTKTAG